MHYCAKVLIFLRKATRRRSAEEISRKVREIRKEMIGERLRRKPPKIFERGNPV